MHYTLDRFEDAGLAVLETDDGESLNVPREELPGGVREGDVLRRLPWYRWTDTVRYALAPELTEARKEEASDLRASLPRHEGEGDIEL